MFSVLRKVISSLEFYTWTNNQRIKHWHICIVSKNFTPYVSTLQNLQEEVFLTIRENKKEDGEKQTLRTETLRLYWKEKLTLLSSKGNNIYVNVHSRDLFKIR